MKITEQMIKILKNFAIIHDSINISEVEYLKTISPSGNIIAVYDLETPFKIPFAIYNLSEFLNVIDIFDLSETSFNFKKNFVVITYKNNKVVYAYTEPSLIKGYDSLKQVASYKKFNKFDGSFELSSNQIKNIRKSANVMDLSTLNIKIKEPNGELCLVDEDYENTNQNSFELKLENVKGKGEFSVDVTSLHIIPGDYEVQFVSNRIMKFINKELPLFYFATANV